MGDIANQLFGPLCVCVASRPLRTLTLMVTMTPQHRKGCLSLLERIASKRKVVAKRGCAVPASALNDIDFFIGLLQDYCTTRYARLPCDAQFHIWAALIYFTEHSDAVPDHAHGRFADVAEAYARIYKESVAKITRYRKFPMPATAHPRKPKSFGRPPGSRLSHRLTAMTPQFLCRSIGFRAFSFDGAALGPTEGVRDVIRPIRGIRRCLWQGSARVPNVRSNIAPIPKLCRRAVRN